jgi:hypothetical protein
MSNETKKNGKEKHLSSANVKGMVLLCGCSFLLLSQPYRVTVKELIMK